MFQISGPRPRRLSGSTLQTIGPEKVKTLWLNMLQSPSLNFYMGDVELLLMQP